MQTSLLGLVREFLVRSSATDHLQVTLSFLAATGDDGQVGWRLLRVRLRCGVGCGPCCGERPAQNEALCHLPCPQVAGALDLLLALLQGSPAQEALAVFLLEQGNLEVLLALLVQPRSLSLLPDRVCKVHPAQPPSIHLTWPLPEGQGGVTSPPPVTPSPVITNPL